MTTVPKDYASYIDHFSIDEVVARLDDHQDGRLNAFDACCARHLREGNGERIALVHEDTQGKITRWSYAALEEASARLAGWLQSAGLGAGDRIACMLPRTPELMIAVLATWRIGAVYQPLFTAFGPDAVDFRLARAELS